MPDFSTSTPTPAPLAERSTNWQKRQHRPRGGASRVLATHRLQPDLERMAADRADAWPQPAGSSRIAQDGRRSRHSESFTSRRRTMSFNGLRVWRAGCAGAAAGCRFYGPRRRPARSCPRTWPRRWRQAPGRDVILQADRATVEAVAARHGLGRAQVAEDRRGAGRERRAAPGAGGGPGRRAPLRRHAGALDDGRDRPGDRRRPGVGRAAAGRGVGHRARHRRGADR